jgi:hypothetical protein
VHAWSGALKWDFNNLEGRSSADILAAGQMRCGICRKRPESPFLYPWRELMTDFKAAIFAPAQLSVETGPTTLEQLEARAAGVVSALDRSKS